MKIKKFLLKYIDLFLIIKIMLIIIMIEFNFAERGKKKLIKSPIKLNNTKAYNSWDE